MRLVHDSAEGRHVLATQVETADNVLQQGVGLMFRRSISDDYGLAFRFSKARRRDIHMLFVFFPIDVIWARDSEVVKVETLRPWLGYGAATADLIVELPEGAASDVAIGDRLALVD
ncbi:DUF192 domain-containing protein [Haladaptatus sp. GCM10025707]|uniref:DUF192 domain-containing protein n=1 Tax=unclassified Haladaptatus TaxID=2622732 RepID=UPI0023E89BC2|nr:DUF192 domain-containing protein [Haladaptatus sp. QDMS2]